MLHASEPLSPLHCFLSLSALPGPALGPEVPAPSEQDHGALALASPFPQSWFTFLPTPLRELSQQVARGCDSRYNLFDRKEAAMHSWVKRPHQLSTITFAGPSKAGVTHYPIRSLCKGA